MSSADETMAKHPFVARFIDQGRARSTEGLPQWWADFRTSALQRLVGLDVPGAKDEEWRFIRLASLAGEEFVAEFDADRQVNENELSEVTVPESAGARLVFSNGQFLPELSDTSALADEVTVTTWSQLREAGDLDEIHDYLDIADFWEDDLFYNLNGANFEDGAVIMVPRNEVVETPIHIVYLANGEGNDFAAHPRNIIVAGESAQVTVIEEFAGAGEGTYFHNVVDEISLGANAKVRHIKVQQDQTTAYHFARNVITLSQDSNYEGTAVNFGGQLSRNDSYARFDGKNIECTLDGLAYVQGRQVTDTHTAIDHALPDSTSYQLHKTIVDDRAHSVFNGKIFVRKDAQRIDSNQLNQNLVLSPRARVDTKPQLEIFADDVVCSHGATVGQLDDEQLFYLMSRGIDAERGQAILTYAFAAEVLETIGVDSLRERLEEQVLEVTSAVAE